MKIGEQDFNTHIQHKAESHLAACEEALHDDLPETPAYGPYCGCDTCMVREVLSVCWDEMLAQVRLEHQAEISS